MGGSPVGGSTMPTILRLQDMAEVCSYLLSSGNARFRDQLISCRCMLWSRQTRQYLWLCVGINSWWLSYSDHTDAQLLSCQTWGAVELCDSFNKWQVALKYGRWASLASRKCCNCGFDHYASFWPDDRLLEHLGGMGVHESCHTNGQNSGELGELHGCLMNGWTFW